MRPVLTILFAFALCTTLSAVAWSHHSRGNFNLEETVELSGTVTEYSWRNPHTFATLAVQNDEDVEDEREAWRTLMLDRVFRIISSTKDGGSQKDAEQTYGALIEEFANDDKT